MMKINYYIIGSKYGSREDGYLDVLPDMLKKGVISTGFSGHLNLKELLGKDHTEIKKYLSSQKESADAFHALKLFLNIKPGDLVAIKIHSSPSGYNPRLLIGAFAIVSGENTPIYSIDEELGHTIEVEYIEANISILFPYGYGGTIHKLNDNTRIKKIFGNYANYNTQIAKSKIIKDKDITPSVVSSRKGYMIQKIHNLIQNKFKQNLIDSFGIDAVKVEENYIDILVELPDKIILYEIKSYQSVIYCIREALGQLLYYGWSYQERSEKSLEYVVVGPNAASNEEKKFIGFITNSLKIKLSYEHLQI